VDGQRNETVATVYVLESGNEIHIKSGAKVIIESGLRISVVGAGGFIDIGLGGVSIQGTMVFINSGGSPAVGTAISAAEPELALVGDVVARPEVSAPYNKEVQKIKGGQKPAAKDPDLQRIIDQLYKPTDTIPGGTAGAVRQELKPGNRLVATGIP